MGAQHDKVISQHRFIVEFTFGFTKYTWQILRQPWWWKRPWPKSCFSCVACFQTSCTVIRVPVWGLHRTQQEYERQLPLPQFILMLHVVHGTAPRPRAAQVAPMTAQKS